MPEILPLKFPKGLTQALIALEFLEGRSGKTYRQKN